MNDIEEQILECFPSGSYALSALLRLLDIVESDEVPGDSMARLISIEAEDGRLLDIIRWQDLFDLSLEVAGESWTGAAELVDVARFGHFTDGELPWEKMSFSTGLVRSAA